MTAWKKGTYHRDVHQMDGTTSGYVSKYFGIHNSKGVGWRVTHLPTGLALSAIDGKSLKRAKAICDKLAELDWSATDMNEIARTNGMNGAHYLASHLRSVIDEHDSRA